MYIFKIYKKFTKIVKFFEKKQKKIQQLGLVSCMNRLSAQNVLKKNFFSVLIQKVDDGLIWACAIKLKKVDFLLNLI
jgi:hypothetical protein